MPARHGLLVVHQRLVEAAGGGVAEDGREHVERRGVGMRAGRAVVDDHDLLVIADAAQGDGALAILGRLFGVGLVELPRGPRKLR